VRLRAGDVRALARAISTVEVGRQGAAELLAACQAAVASGPGHAQRIGVTGPPGAGKSTLVRQIVRGLRARGKTVGVVAVDPSIPYTGGALLGDRIRMQGFAGDDGVYIRSMASRGVAGGLAATAADVCDLIEAAGREALLIETVGAGQDEVKIAALADVTLVVLAPGMGDEVQSLKAGTMEIADIFVVNNTDLAGAEQMEAGIVAMQALGAPSGKDRGAWLPPVVRTVATTGEGVQGLIETIERFVGDGTAGKRNTTLDWPSLAGPTLDHIGIAVRSISQTRKLYAALGLAVSEEETIEHEQVKTAMLPLGETRLELLEPTAENSTIGRFIARRGEGLHHIAVRAEGDVRALYERLRAQGVRLASDCVRIGAGGRRYFFVHPESAGGVLFEIVGE
jgi:LAO/AO transport system kinase